MEKAITAAMFSVLVSGAVEIEHGDQGAPTQPPDERSEHAPAAALPIEQPGLRNLLLNALGTREPGPGEVRIPIPVDGATYEVIIAKPGLPRSVPVAKDRKP